MKVKITAEQIKMLYNSFKDDGNDTAVMLPAKKAKNGLYEVLDWWITKKVV